MGKKAHIQSITFKGPFSADAKLMNVVPETWAFSFDGCVASVLYFYLDSLLTNETYAIEER